MQERFSLIPCSLHGPAPEVLTMLERIVAESHYDRAAQRQVITASIIDEARTLLVKIGGKVG